MSMRMGYAKPNSNEKIGKGYSSFHHKTSKIVDDVRNFSFSQKLLGLIQVNDQSSVLLDRRHNLLLSLEPIFFFYEKAVNSLHIISCL